MTDENKEQFQDENETNEAPEVAEAAESDEETVKSAADDKKPERKPNFLLQIVAGGYLAYLGVDIIIKLINKTSGSDHPVLFGVFGVLFFIFGAYYCIYGIRAMLKKREDDMAEASRQYADEHPDEFDDEGNYIEEDCEDFDDEEYDEEYDNKDDE